MDWKYEAVEKLKKYDAMRRAVENLPPELEMALQPEKREALTRALENARALCGQVQRGLQVLSPGERLVLARFYIFPGKGVAKRLCEELQVESSSVYRYRDRALGKFVTALYGEIGN